MVYISTKEADTSAKEPYIFTFVKRGTYMSSSTLHIRNAAMVYISTKEPHIVHIYKRALRIHVREKSHIYPQQHSACLRCGDGLHIYKRAPQIYKRAIPILRLWTEPHTSSAALCISEMQRWSTCLQTNPTQYLATKKILHIYMFEKSRLYQQPHSALEPSQKRRALPKQAHLRALYIRKRVC